MEVGLALKLVLYRWDITAYRIAKDSGVSTATINKVIKGDIKTLSWDNVAKIGKALGEKDPMAEDAFFGALRRPIEDFPFFRSRSMPLENILPTFPFLGIIEKTILALDKFGLLNREVVEERGYRLDIGSPLSNKPSLSAAVFQHLFTDILLVSENDWNEETGEDENA